MDDELSKDYLGISGSIGRYFQSVDRPFRCYRVESVFRTYRHMIVETKFGRYQRREEIILLIARIGEIVILHPPGIRDIAMERRREHVSKTLA